MEKDGVAMFACIHIPDFPVEAVVRCEPDLRGQAVAVIEGAPPLVKVIACNDRARAVGVEAGMTEMQAQERMRIGCEAKRWHIKRRAPEQEVAAHAALLDCACGISPRVEATAPDTVIADIAGLESLFGPPSKIALDLAQRCAEIGLEVNVAVAGNPDAALHASRGYAGITMISAGTEADRLGSLPLNVLLATQYGKITDKKQRLATENAMTMLDTLERWGIRTLRALAVLPEVAVVERLGQAGLEWQRFARGAARREINIAEPPLSFEEVCELEYPLDLLEPVAFVLSRMLEQLCARLQSRALATHELRLRLKLDPDVTVDREGLPVESKPGEAENREFLERTIKLPVPMLDAKVFLKLLQLDLKGSPPTAPILKIWLRAEPVRPRFDQHGLFLPLTPEPQKLEITLARLAGIAGGQGNVGAAEVLDTHRPDSFRMTRFLPRPASYEHVPAAEGQSRPMSALRRFRPPQPVSVLMIAEKPGTIGPPRSVSPLEEITRALYGEVVWCAGPWHTSGEWWNQERWEREEWDIAVSTKLEGRSPRWSAACSQADGNVVYRLYRDVLSGMWFVEGEYD